MNIKINPALIAALRFYASPDYAMSSEPSLYVHFNLDGSHEPWPLERACHVAAEVLDEQPLVSIKYRALRQGLVDCGAGLLLQRILGEH